MAARVGLHRDRWHRYCWGNSGWQPGATGILKVQDAIRGSDGLMNWGVNIAIDALQQGASPEQARAAVNEARDRGTAVHAGVEALIGNAEFSPDHVTHPYWYGWAKFVMTEKPEILGSEQMVINLTVGFGGTLDIDAVINGKRSLIDVKTGEVKDNHALQLAAYAAGEWIGKPDDPKKYPMPEWEMFYVLRLMPEAPFYELVPLEVGPDEIDHFIFLAKVHRRLKAWDKREKPSLELVA